MRPRPIVLVLQWSIMSNEKTNRALMKPCSLLVVPAESDPQPLGISLARGLPLSPSPSLSLSTHHDCVVTRSTNTVRLRGIGTGISEASKRVPIFSFASTHWQGGKQASY